MPQLNDLSEIVSYAPDVIIVGAGNAALCAAISAGEQGAKVLIFEAAPESERGGNSHFTGGAFRFAYSGVEEILDIYPDISEKELANIDFGSYSVDQYFDDMYELTQYRTDADLCEILIKNSHESAKWISKRGVKLQPGLGRQAYKVDGKFKFWGGLALHIWGGGPELLKALYQKAKDLKIGIAYQTPVHELLMRDQRVIGVKAHHKGQGFELSCKAVILACGSFESNPEMRARYLGPGWDLAKVRGTKFNMGAGLNMAMAAGAMPYGNWSGCHSVAWDVNAPPYGDLSIGDQFQKHNYPYGIIVNLDGERYVDEGKNFHSHTYAKYGGEILKQPGMQAWQVFDAKSTPLLRSEYFIRRTTKAEANSLEELAEKLDGVNAQRFLTTVKLYNESCNDSTDFNPNILDGKATEGLLIDKTNWACPLDTPPYHAYHVTTGVTFTFGGVKVTTKAQVESIYGSVIPGLFAAGEMVGGLFYHNYASGTGLMSGATFGRIAGSSAVEFFGSNNA
jgi:tricarballylate dehydrogenase